MTNLLFRFSVLLLGLFTIACGSFATAAEATAELSQYQTIDRLGYDAEDSSAAVPKLEKMLTSEDPQVRWRAARSLGLLGAEAAAASPKLVKLLSDSDPVVQVHAAIALARIGDKSEATLEALLAKVTSPDERVSRTAVQTLRHLGAPPEKLADALEVVLESGNAAVMTHVVDAVVQRGAAATPALNAALGKEKAAYWAAVAIGEIGPEAAGTTPALIKLLGQTKDERTLQLALVALAKIGPAAQEASAAVQKVASTTKEAGARIAACYALGAIGDESATDLLRKLETSGGPFQTMVAAWAVSKLHPNDPAALEHAITLLVGGLKSDREEVRNAAAAGLKELGAPADEVAPALIAAVKDATPAQQSHIAFAMASLGPEAVTPAVKMLGHPELRDVGIEVLGRLGKDASEGVDGLVTCLSLDAADTVTRAQFALASIGEGASGAADDLAKNLQSKAEEVRHSALFALRQLGAKAESASEPLHEFMESTNNKFEQYATAWALARMQLKAHLLEDVTGSLDEALDSENEQVRLETISAIHDLGPASALFKDKLKEMAQSDPSPEVRAAAAE